MFEIRGDVFAVCCHGSLIRSMLMKPYRSRAGISERLMIEALAVKVAGHHLTTVIGSEEDLRVVLKGDPEDESSLDLSVREINYLCRMIASYSYGVVLPACQRQDQVRSWVDAIVWNHSRASRVFAYTNLFTASMEILKSLQSSPRKTTIEEEGIKYVIDTDGTLFVESPSGYYRTLPNSLAPHLLAWAVDSD